MKEIETLIENEFNSYNGKPRVILMSPDAFAILCADASVEAKRRIIPKIYRSVPIVITNYSGITVNIL